MCGLAGFLSPSGMVGLSAEHAIAAMTDTLKRRGPDDSGVWLERTSGVALGHRRLSILDLSPAGHQPMQSHSGRYVIVFNGEIYNHLELRTDLRRAWRSTNDTETLLAAIDEWGLQRTLDRLVGMFAFALWDKEDRCMFLARDRFGEKPLYYGLSSGSLIFGSELRALRAFPAFSCDIDITAVRLLLEHNCIPAPWSIYAGIRKLPAGTWIRIAAENVSTHKLPDPHTYWSIDQVVDEGVRVPFRGTFEDATAELDLLLKCSLKGQQLADVPLGAFLSGGIDSSLVVATLQKISDQPIKTFSMGVQDSKLDESRHAAVVAAWLKTDHHETIVSGEQALGTVTHLADVWGEPFADSSQIPTLLLSQFAAQHVKVALSGDGGDELFLGYDHYRYLHRLWKGRSIGRLPLMEIADMVEKSSSTPSWIELARKVRFVAGVLGESDPVGMVDRYMDRHRGLRPAVRGTAPRLASNWNSLTSAPEIALVAAARDVRSYLSDDILVKVDRASMSCSLETRAPLLDHRIAKFAFSLPLDFKMRGRKGKRILRAALGNVLPKALFDRPKQGFSIPVGAWLRSDLRTWGTDLIQSKSVADGFLDMERVREVWQEHQDGLEHGGRLWAILMLLQFLRTH